MRRTAGWLVVAGLGAGGWVAYSSEPGQRALGRREYFRARPVVEPPDYASATIATSFEAIYSEEASTLRFEMVQTIDAASQRAKADTSWAATGFSASGQSIPATATAFAPGTQPPPQPATSGMSATIATVESTYKSGATEADPWTREPNAEVQGSLVDPRAIPTYEELVGFELESMPSWDPRTDQGPLDLASQTAEVEGLLDANEATATPPQAVPQRTPTDVPAEVVRLMRWSTDIASLRYLSPQMLADFEFVAPDDASVVFTLGFDSAGLARYFDISIALPVALAALDTEEVVFQWMEWRVLSVSDDPVTIDLPVNVVDAPPA